MPFRISDRFDMTTVPSKHQATPRGEVWMTALEEILRYIYPVYISRRDGQGQHLLAH